MEAILEKYKKKPEQQNELLSQDKAKDIVQETGAPDSASSAVVIAAVNVVQAEANLDFDAVVGDVSKTSLTAGEPPTMFGITDSERTLAPAGLGEGSLKSEGSADMFHDDIFRESPAGNRKMGLMLGKGDGVPMVRSGLHDHWDDAEGYYSYQFGEVMKTWT